MYRTHVEICAKVVSAKLWDEGGGQRRVLFPLLKYVEEGNKTENFLLGRKEGETEKPAR